MNRDEYFESIRAQIYALGENPQVDDLLSALIPFGTDDVQPWVDVIVANQVNGSPWGLEKTLAYHLSNLRIASLGPEMATGAYEFPPFYMAIIIALQQQITDGNLPFPTPDQLEYLQNFLEAYTTVDEYNKYVNLITQCWVENQI
jgi:hypothetical protein